MNLQVEIFLQSKPFQCNQQIRVHINGPREHGQERKMTAVAEKVKTANLQKKLCKFKAVQYFSHEGL